MKSYRIWLVFATVVIIASVFAAQTQVLAAEKASVVENSPISGSVEFTGSKDFAVWLYAERKVAENLGVYINAAQFRMGFQEVTFGPAYYLTPEMQVGVSLGMAKHSSRDDTRWSVSTFWYWKTDRVEAEATVEKHGHDPMTYYRAYIQTPIILPSRKLAFGVYGEDGIGWGPRIAWSFGKNIDLWLAPLVERIGGNVVVGGLRFTF